MDSFLKLIEQVAQLEEDENFDKNLQTYRNLFSILEHNEELINDLKRQYRSTNKQTTDIIAEKEDFLHEVMKFTAEDVHLNEKKKKIITEFLATVSNIIDIVVDDLYRDYININCEICRPKAKLPTYAHKTDAGFDFYLPEDFTIKAHEYGKIAPTGLKISIPSGYELQIRPRSGNSVKTTLRIANAPGTIDSGYANEIGIICDNIGEEDITFKAGDRIAQGVFTAVPKGVFTQVNNIHLNMKEDRGGGFGSTGK